MKATPFTEGTGQGRQGAGAAATTPVTLSPCHPVTLSSEEAEFYEGYAWCLNPYPTVGETVERLAGELAQLAGGLAGGAHLLPLRVPQARPDAPRRAGPGAAARGPLPGPRPADPGRRAAHRRLLLRPRAPRLPPGRGLPGGGRHDGAPGQGPG